MQKTLRMFSLAGPCLTSVAGAGPIIRETAKFWITRSHNGEERRVSKANHRAHVEPCNCCTDHPRTQYPYGYID